MTSSVAVLTGDLIGSTKAGTAAIAEAMTALGEAADEIALWQGQRPTRFTRYRGDGWQILVEAPHLALRSALYLLARLRARRSKLQTRIAIGLGPVTSRGTRDLADAAGPAFEASGRGLDAMKKRQLYIDGEAVTDLHWAVVQLAAERAGRWSPEQAEAMAMALDPANPTLAEIAARLGISAQAVGYRLTGAGASTFRDALSAWERSLKGESTS